MATSKPLDTTELKAVEPTRVIRALLGVSSALVVIGVIEFIVLGVAAAISGVLPGQHFYGESSWEFNGLTAVYGGAAILALVTSLWLSYMARGLASVIHMMAGPAQTGG